MTNLNTKACKHVYLHKPQNRVYEVNHKTTEWDRWVGLGFFKCSASCNEDNSPCPWVGHDQHDQPKFTEDTLICADWGFDYQ